MTTEVITKMNLVGHVTLLGLAFFAAIPTTLAQACCSQDYKNCIDWCGTTEAECTCDTTTWLANGAVTGTCVARWQGCNNPSDVCCPGLECTVINQWHSQCEVLVTLPPTISSEPTQTPTKSPAPSISPRPTGESVLFSTTESLTVYDAFLRLASLSYTVSSNPYTLSVKASGGVAGPGGDVVSEGQAYGVLICGIALASGRLSATEYNNVLTAFEGYFNGWKKMCENSSSVGAGCQSGGAYCSE